jgi:beta-lactamase regulating signal transducer with metallopeptidase domain
MLFVIDWALKASLLLALAGVMDLLLRRKPASVRHLTWALALAGGLVIPLASVLMPTWRVPLVAVRRPAATVASQEPASLVEQGGAISRVIEPAPQTPDVTVAPPAGDAFTVTTVLEPRTAGGLGWVRTIPWAALAWGVWVSGSVLLLLSIGVGILRTRAMMRRAHRVVTGPIAAAARGIARQLGIGRAVTILQGRSGLMPMTWGLLRPVVLVPADADQWTASRLRAVLLHELGHVKRYDCLTQVLARAACALYWVNPLVWLGAMRLRVERELACDDLVLAAGSRASEYAGHLVEVARSLHAERLASAAAIAMARPSHLGRRVSALLDAGRERGVARAGLVTSASMVAGALVLPLAGVRVWHTPATDEAAQAVWFATDVESQPAAVLTPPSPGVEQTPPARTGARPRSALAALRAEIRELESRPARLISNLKGWAGTVSAGLGLRPPVPTGPSLPAAAAPVAQSCTWVIDRNTSASVNVDDDAMTVRIRAGDCRLEIQSEGEVEFTGDDADVARISRGGFLEIEERQGRSVRLLEIRAANGGLARRWLVDGDERPYDDAARGWLAHVLPVVFRRTGIDAERRAERILQRGGVDALLAEIALIPSDWAARQYYAVLLARRDVDAPTLRRVVQQAGRDIGSDFELAELLVGVARHQAVDENVRIAYVEATGQIDSSFERRRALSAILGRQGLSTGLADAMLQQSVEIESDFELAELLMSVIAARPAGTPLPAAFWQAVDGIGSSFERSRVLKAVVARSAGSEALLEKVLESGAGVDSDFERAELLITVAGQYPSNQALPAAYLQAVGTMSSGFELRRALDALVKRPGVSGLMLVSILQAAQNITSDFERAELLVNLARGYPLTDATRQPFFTAAAGIDGDFEHARVLKTVIAKGDLDSATVRALLVAASGISSDFELATVLVAVAAAHPIGDDLRPAFLRAADEIQSDYERGRVLNALYRRGTRADA